MRFRLIATSITLTCGIALAPAGLNARESHADDARQWTIDPARSEVRFTVTKLGFSDVTGVFRESEGEIYYDEARPGASRVQWRVRTASVKTDEPNRDSSLRQPEYFDAERHPWLEFASQSVRALDTDRIEVSGHITMRGVTRPLTFIVRCVQSGAAPRFETDFTLDRYDFGITGGTVMGRLIGRTVRVHLVAGVRAPGGVS